MNNVERSEQATPTRRRRRRSRGRGQGKNTSPQASAQSTGQSTRQTSGQSQPKKSSRSGAKSKANAKNTAKNTAKATAKSTAKAAAKTPDRGSGKAATRSGAKQSRGGKRRPTQGRRGNARRSAAQRSNSQAPRYTSIETSAGGLVASGLAESVREDGSVNLSTIYVALIGRLDRRNRLLWSMPKGHVEPGEAHDSTAEREVWEETGIHGEVLVELGVIDYWFVSEGKRIHKTVHHHLLRYVDGDLNDEDPEVTEVCWVPADTLVERLAYADERKLARRAHDLLPDIARAEKQAGRATPR